MPPSQSSRATTLRHGALEAGADVLAVHEIMFLLTRRNRSNSYFRDGVHPNERGHAMLGALTARYVARRVANLTAAATAVRAPRKIVAEWVKEPETCFGRADKMPLMRDRMPRNGTWALVDEGKAKAVPKLGMLSTRPGETLVLGPIRPPKASGSEQRAASNCALLEIELGYLLSAYPVGDGQPQGGLRIACVGCDCAPKPDYYQAQTAPFPCFETNATGAASPHMREENVSVTLTTQFWAVWTEGRECRVEVTHLPAARVPSMLGNRVRCRHADPARIGHTPSGEPLYAGASRVRVDSLHLMDINLRSNGDVTKVRDVTHAIDKPKHKYHPAALLIDRVTKCNAGDNATAPGGSPTPAAAASRSGATAAASNYVMRDEGDVPLLPRRAAFDGIFLEPRAKHTSAAFHDAWTAASRGRFIGGLESAQVALAFLARLRARERIGLGVDAAPAARFPGRRDPDPPDDRKVPREKFTL